MTDTAGLRSEKNEVTLVKDKKLIIYRPTLLKRNVTEIKNYLSESSLMYLNHSDMIIEMSMSPSLRSSIQLSIIKLISTTQISSSISLLQFISTQTGSPNHQK